MTYLGVAMTDMLVNLYAERENNEAFLWSSEGVKIRRALAIDKAGICQFVSEEFRDICAGWVDECESTLYRHPTSCFIAIKEKQIVGFACYDGTAKGMVGPIGVAPDYRKKGIARALLNASFDAMKAEGYAYAIIGWVSSTDFYEKTCSAIPIPNSFPGIYARMTMHN